MSTYFYWLNIVFSTNKMLDCF